MYLGAIHIWPHTEGEGGGVISQIWKNRTTKGGGGKGSGFAKYDLRLALNILETWKNLMMTELRAGGENIFEVIV